MTVVHAQRSRLVTALPWFFLAVWLSSGVLAFHYAGTRPRTPRPETGNVYELNMHGSYSYLTFQDCLRLYGAMGIGWGGNLAIYIVYLWRRGWVAALLLLTILAPAASAQPDQSSLLNELARLDALQLSRLAALSRGETVAPTDELGEHLADVLDAVCGFDDPAIVKPLLPFLGTGNRVVESVARFGEYSVEQIAAFVDSPASEAIGASSALFTLRVIQRSQPLSTAGRATIIRIAGQRLEGQQAAAVIEQALELAIATGDTRLAERVKTLARDSSQMRALVTPGSSDGSIVDHLQRKARSLLARE
jgi:hypothetical protein